MKARERMKLDRAQSQSEGSIWELCLFAVFFVLIFSAIARADDGAAPRESERGVAAVGAGKSARASGGSKSAASSSRLVAQGGPKKVPTAAAQTPATPASENPAIEKPIRAKQQQLAPGASDALPAGTVGATLAEPKINGPRFTTTARLLVETTATVSSEEPRSYGGWYQMAFGVADSQTNMALNVLASYSREYSYQRDDGTDGDVDNPIINLSKKWKNGVHFRSPVFDTISLGLQSTVGVSRESRRRTFNGSMGPTLNVSKELGKLSVGVGGGYARGFYGYDIRDDGTVNSPNSFIGTGSLSYAITDKLSASAFMLYTYAISFQNVGRSTEFSILSMNYAFTKKFSVSVGGATQRGTQEADGITNSVKIFDPNVAQAFLDLNFTL